MKQLSLSFKGAAFAVMIASASIANAATTHTDLGTVEPGTTFSQYFDVPRLGVFTDIYSFSLLTAGASDVTRTITYTIDEGFNQALSGFNGLTRGLFSGATDTQVAWSSFDAATQRYFYTDISAGDYYFKVEGEGWRAGSHISEPRYNAMLNISAAPVPEPEAYAMLLAGLDILGTVVKRRSNHF